MEFSELGLSPDILEGIEAMGFREPTPVQAQAIPAALKGSDLIACAQTGTGKTAAYLLPVIDKIISERKDGDESIKAMVIVPTRELALQIDQQLEGMAYFTPITSFAVYGGGDGVSFGDQKKALTMGAEVIVATPGKLMSHLNLGYVKVDQLKYLVLDEADRMLDMGFIDDIVRIMDYLPKERQNLMFSATMPNDIRALAKKVLKDPKEIEIELSKPAEGILQVAYCIRDDQKSPLVERLLKDKDMKSIIIFSATKKKVKEVTRDLKKKGMNARDIHSDLDQDEREVVMRDFRNKKFPILVATNVVSRGIDVEDIELVLNFDVPDDAEDYVHRIGRTARAASTGIAITLIGSEEQRKFKKIEELIGSTVYKSPLPDGIQGAQTYNPGETRPKSRFNRKGGSSNRGKGGPPNRGPKRHKRN